MAMLNNLSVIFLGGNSSTFGWETNEHRLTSGKKNLEDNSPRAMRSDGYRVAANHS
jgi:hypothetical protein